jgi:hypothetical protein
MRAAQAPGHVPELVTGVITYLPDRHGYHATRLEVVQACLGSMRKGAPGAAVLVWDNGSGKELRDWLVNDYKPDYLVLSPNIGKQSARAAIVGMFPPKTIIGVSDDDMLFYPGWLEAHLRLLKGFPNVGMVSGWPVRASFGWATDHTVKWGEVNGEIRRGRFISDDEERDYALSVGLVPSEHLRRFKDRKDIQVEYQSLTAYATAQHCQFLCYAGMIAALCKWEGAAMGDEKPFDCGMDEAGLLRLTTIERTTRHMGNVVDDRLRAELKGMEL